MRAFVAAEVTDRAARERIGAFQRSAGGAGKAVEPHNLHFTLRFLGEITGESARATADALKSVRFRSFDVALRGAGSFGRPPRVVWVGTDPDGGQGLRRLAGAVNSAVGGGADKPFRPHLTILRVKRGRSIDISGYDGYEWGVQHIDAIKLKRSVLSKDGPAYTDLAEVPAE